MNNNLTLSELKACILGHAVGDALGVPVEFSPREKLGRDPVTSMRGYGTYGMPAGSWSDDTSMTLCALDSLAKDEFSWEDVMLNFGKWYFEDQFTPTGVTFDVGGTCARAITEYFMEKKDVSLCGRRGERDNGNGSLMRIHPFALCSSGDLPFIETASALTHAHRRSQMACGIYGLILDEILSDRSRDAVRRGLARAEAAYGAEHEWLLYAPLACVEERSRESINSGGYVVSTLEAALWCLLTTDSYAECVLKAVDLGSDTDTTAAVAGGLAGALYGWNAIPAEWLNTLAKREELEALCERAFARWSA